MARLSLRESGNLQTDLRLVVCEDAPCEERLAIDNSVRRRFLGSGEENAGAPLLYAPDHLGTTHITTNLAAQEVERLNFDPWGRRSLLVGGGGSVLGYTGYRWEADAEVWLSQFRPYDPGLGRWLSEDPIGMVDGPNVLAYVQNDPTNLTDPDGLAAEVCCRPLRSKLMKFARHCYIRADDGTRYGLHREKGAGRRQTNNKSDVGGRCKPCTPKCEDQNACFEKAHEDYPEYSKYKLFGPNSNTYAGTIARACCKEGMPPGLGMAPGTNDPPAPPAPPRRR